MTPYGGKFAVGLFDPSFVLRIILAFRGSNTNGVRSCDLLDFE